MHRGSITIVCKNDLAEFDRFHRMVCHFCELHDVPPRTLHALTLALDEIFTNILSYAYKDGGSHEITAHIDFEPGTLKARVEDDGDAFNPLDVPPVDITRPMGEREVGGLGIHLVRSLMSQVEYTRTGGKNVLTLAKKIR